MNEIYQKKKIKTALIGNGNWGSKVLNAISLMSRYEIVGIINSSIEHNQKKQILENSDLLYIALHPDKQLEYVKYGIENNKHIVCESPFLTSIDDRKKIFNEFINKDSSKCFYINYPYVQDQDFLHLCKRVMSLKANFISLKVSGPDLENDLTKSKKMYLNQAIFLVIFLHAITGKDRLESFDILNKDLGQIRNMNGNTYEFSWGISEKPNLEFIFKSENVSETHNIIYDQYDQIIPLLTMISNQIYKIYPSTSMENIPHDSIKEIWTKMFATGFLYGASAEYFSDIFCNISSEDIPFSITNPVNLYLNGGF